MSLKEAYTLAHTAQCRLQIAASRPDRNLRFVVGHLMHYESLRLRIVEIEHDISKSKRTSSVAFKGTGHVDHRLQHKPSTGQLGRKSPPPPPQESEYDYDTDSDDEDDVDFDDEAEDGLSLERFPSGAAKPASHPEPSATEPPELDYDDDDEDYSDDDEEPRSPEEPTQDELQRTIKGDGNELLATEYEAVRKCVCHGKTDAPSFDRMWELPSDQANAKEGVTRAVARVSAEPAAPQSVCSKLDQLSQQEVAA